MRGRWRVVRVCVDAATELPGTATPAEERASARCVLDHLLSDPALIPETRVSFQAALRQLVAVAAAENEEADVYVDADANNETSHWDVADGFAAVGVIDALTAAVPKVGRIVVWELRLDAMPDARANDLGLSAPSAADLSRRLRADWPRGRIG